MFTNITVEPILFLYVLAYMITNIIEKDYFEILILNDLRYNEFRTFNKTIIITDISKDYYDFLLNSLTVFIKYKYFVEYGIVLLLIPFYILLNRVYGSVALIVLSLMGKITYTSLMILYIYMNYSSAYNIIYYISIPTSLLGSNILVFANCFNLYSEYNLRKHELPNYFKEHEIYNLIGTKSNYIEEMVEIRKKKYSEHRLSKSYDQINILHNNHKKNNCHEYNKYIIKNLTMNINLLIDMIEKQGKNLEIIINRINNQLSIEPLKNTVGILSKNFIIIGKIIKIILSIINNNDNLYKYPELIHCMKNIGLYNKGTILSYNDTFIDFIHIRPKSLVYDTVDYSYINNMKKVEYAKKNIRSLLKHIYKISDISKLSSKMDNMTLEKVEYISRLIRNVENILRHILIIIKSDSKTILKINPDLDIHEASININPKSIQKPITPEINVNFSHIHFIYILSIPLGIYIGKALFNRFENFIIIFSINFVLLITCLIYTLLRFKLKLNPPDEYGSKIFVWEYLKNVLCFNYNNKKDVFIICLCTFLYMVEREENNVLYIYTKAVFNWSYNEYSIFKIIHISISSLILLISFIYAKIFINNKKHDIILGAIFYIAGQIIFLVAKENVTVFYAGLSLSPFGILILNNIRSFIPSITTSTERIQLFILCGIIEQFGCLTFEFILHTLFVIYRQSIFYVTLFNHFIILLSTLFFLK